MWQGFEFFKPSPLPLNASPLEQHLADHRLLSEYASLFDLSRVFAKQSDANSLITIAQYRRFVLNVPLGLKSTSPSWARVLSPQAMQDLHFQDELFPTPGKRYLIGSPLHVPGGILSNYAESHYTRDILQFTASLVDAGIMCNSEAYAFLSQPILIPSPSCGSFPLQGFLEIMQVLESATKAFFENGYQAYDDRHQGRVCGALIERLNSYLLIKQLSAQGISGDEVAGYTTLVSDTLEVPRGLMAQTLAIDA